MNPSHKRMNDFIRGRVIIQQPQQQPAAIANANAGNNTGNRIPKAQPQSMTAIIRQAHYSNYKGPL